MKNTVLSIVFLFPLLAMGQSTDQNYVKTTVYRNPAQGNPLPTVTYYDGLGRPVQQVVSGQSGAGKDIITPITYDVYGRQAIEYLPWASTQTNMAYADSTSVHTGLNSQYSALYNDINPFSEKAFEASPLSRVLKQAAPGDAWKMGGGHEVRFDYQTNDSLEVRLFRVVLTPQTSGLYDIAFSDDGYYDPEKLYKTITKDENWSGGVNHTTEEFTDIEGRVVLKRTYADYGQGTEAHDMYYVYDDYGNLTYVLPPLLDGGSIDQTILDGLCYQYKYDGRNRLVEKKLPGKQWEYIVYNSQNMPVATGPAFDPFGQGNTGWMITKFDAFGRVVYTGWMEDGVDSQSRVAFQGQMTGGWAEVFDATGTTLSSVAVSYTNDVYPTDFELLSVNYYDGYDFAGAPQNLPSNVLGIPIITEVKGLATGSWVRVLDDPNTTVGEASHILYDERGRVVSTRKENYLGGYTLSESELDFTGKPKKTIAQHKRRSNDLNLIVSDTYQYTAQDRLLMHTQQINNLPKERIVYNTYDVLGKLILKQVGSSTIDSTTELQRVDYAYTIRGWLKSINDVDSLSVGGALPDLFAFKIHYDQVDDDISGEVSPLYNGNISETFWRSGSDNVQRKYGYGYDALNRLRTAVYQKPQSAVPVNRMYDEQLEYDKNGNITTLMRNGDLDSDIATVSAFRIDRLSYTYDQNNPNQLMKVTDYEPVSLGFKDDAVTDPGDTNDDYKYDDNGNMVMDENKGIENISYNHLNLPVEINFASGSRIKYLYNALGQKLRKEVVQDTISTVTDYLDGYQYTNGSLNFFPHAEGYVNVTNCEPCQGVYKFDYVYNYTDHLGNIRLSYGEDKVEHVLKILEENHYYPFGLKHTNYNTQKRIFERDEEFPELSKIAPVPVNSEVPYKYKYNGKEYQDELGLNMYDYGARNYDPAIGRWMNIDPLAEKSRRFSPYTYALNNPVYFIDPDGMQAIANDNDDEIITNSQGHVVKVVPNDKENTVYQYNEDKTKLTKVEDLKDETKKAEGVKRGDIINDEGELFRIVPNVKVLRKDIDVTGDDKYGHWWVEIGKSESYGWWPKEAVGLADTVAGVDGELNGQTNFGGTPTQDPHHGDRSDGTNFFNVYTTNAATTKGVDNKIRDFAKKYSGQWSYPTGQNCHSFQDSFLEKLNLTINPN